MLAQIELLKELVNEQKKTNQRLKKIQGFLNKEQPAGKANNLPQGSKDSYKDNYTLFKEMINVIPKNLTQLLIEIQETKMIIAGIIQPQDDLDLYAMIVKKFQCIETLIWDSKNIFETLKEHK